MKALIKAHPVVAAAAGLGALWLAFVIIGPRVQDWALKRQERKKRKSGDDYTEYKLSESESVFLPK